MKKGLLHNNIYNFFYQREFRPAWLFHLPTFFIYLYFAIRARHFFFFSAANPMMNMGGFMGNSKHQGDDLVCYKYKIKTEYFLKDTSQDEVVERIHHLSYPLIIKPTIGGRQGYNVFYITSESELSSYLSLLQRDDFMIQEYIEGEEYSIYYYCYPDQKIGNILGITQKRYPTIEGDGESTIGRLIKNHKRYHHYYKLFHDDYHIDMSEVLPSGMSKQIATIGNHCKGSLFLDRSNHITEILLLEIKKMHSENSNIYIYRSDIKAQSRDSIVKGDYKVIELNGIFSEPTYIYDPDYKLIDAYKEIYKVRYHTYKIALYNHNNKNIPYFSLWKGIQLVIGYLRK